MPDFPIDLIERLAPVLDDELTDLASSNAARALFGEIIETPRETAVPSTDSREPLAQITRSESAAGPSTGGAFGRVAGHRLPTWTIAAVSLLILASATVVTVATLHGPSQRIFPANVIRSLSSPPGGKQAWRLVNVLSSKDLSEGALPSSASMLSCPTSEQCYTISNPALRRISAAPDYMTDVGVGSLDVSSDGGISWNALPLPGGVTFTTPLVCETAQVCAVGALNLGVPETISKVAPSNAASIVADLIGSPSQPKTCDLDQLTETQVLAVFAEYSQVAAAANAGQGLTNPCAADISSGVSTAISGQLDPAEVGSPQYSILPSGGDASALDQAIDSMAIYRTDGMSPVVETTTDGGMTWNADPLPAGTGPLISLSCPSPSTCMVLTLDKTVIGPTDAIPGVTYNTPIFEPVSFTETTDDGASWSTTSFPDSDTPISISCSSTTSCLAVGVDGTGTPFGTHTGRGLVLQTTDGGSMWTPASLPSDVGSVTEATCPSATICYAIGNQYPLPTPVAGVALSSSDGGTSWSTLALPTSLDKAPFTSISCPSATSCSISGRVAWDIETNVDNNLIGSGPSGNSDVIPEGISGPNGPYNPVDGQPNSGPAMILSTQDAGETWNLQTFGWREANGNELKETTDVQCPAENRCVAMGGSSSLTVPVLIGSI